jgi:hypothetical protein
VACLGGDRGRQFCYTLSMNKGSRPRRAGATETFSVSVDPETKRALRQLADREYGGNLSAVVTDLAEDARRRMAAGAYLERQGLPVLSPPELDDLEATIARERAAWRKRPKRRTVA